MTIRVNECDRLFDELENDNAFDFECFRQTSYCKRGQVGKYISKNFRDYIFNGDVDPRNEGLIVTLYFTNESGADAVVTRASAKNPAVMDNSDVLEEAPLVDRDPPRFFLAKPDIPVDDNSAVDNYINGYWYK